MRLEDPRSGAAYRVIGRTYGVLGADDRQVVFVPAACGSDCDLTLADLTRRLVPVPAGEPGQPAGRRVLPGRPAARDRVRRHAAGRPEHLPQRDGYVAVIDLDTGFDHVRLVPELTTGPASTALPVWSPDGRLLLAVPTDGSGSGRVVAWHAGRAQGHDPAGRPDRLLRHCPGTAAPLS